MSHWHVLTTSPNRRLSRPQIYLQNNYNQLTIIKHYEPSLSPVSMLPVLVYFSSTLAYVHAVTVYGQIALGFSTTSAAHAPTSTPNAYNNTRLIPPPIPNPAPASFFSLILQQDAAVVDGLSIPHVGGCFWGFSIEMSVISQVRKSDFLLDLVYLFIYLILICLSWQKLVCLSCSFCNKNSNAIL